MSTRQQRIAELAKRKPPRALTALNQYIDLSWLREAYRRTRKDGAVGVDGQTAEAYEQDLEANLQSLLDRAKSGRYRAPAVRRVNIPKGKGGDTRPLGIPTFEDKVLQRAVAMVLEAIYEEDFYDFSYGFRPGRSAHQALEALWRRTMRMRGSWIVEVDIQKCFDTLDHAHLRALLQRRVRDGVVLRLIGKWLNAGVLEDGQLSYPTAGSPQGGVISPILMNVYLHYVLDEWFVQEVQPRLKGTAFLVRYADDCALGFSDESDAKRVLEVLPKRFAKFGLTLHPEKTRLVPFRQPPGGDAGQGKGGTGTFDLLGFTHYWGVSRQGRWVVKRKTARSRAQRGLRTITEWCRRNRHLPVAEQHRALSRKLQGHYAYYGITGNSEALARFRYAVLMTWRKWLGRRRRRGRLNWAHFERLLERYPLPPPICIHSIYRRSEPVT